MGQPETVTESDGRYDGKTRQANYVQDVAAYLNSVGIAARRTGRTGHNLGDLVLDSTIRTVTEIKYHPRDVVRGIRLGLDTAINKANELHNPIGFDTRPLPLVIVKRPRRPVEDSYVVLRLSDVADLVLRSD